MAQEDMLTLTIQSFSYKQGVPVIISPHGGGFVFDCRAILNPGRLPEFKEKTGLDADVAKFLTGREDAEQFFSLVSQIVKQSVASYLDRGFQQLSVTFGCTGGQHRSVYFSERLAKLFQGREDLKVEVSHRELIDGKPKKIVAGATMPMAREPEKSKPEVSKKGSK